MKKILWFSLLLFVVGVNAQTFTNSTKVIGIPTNNVINYSDTVLSNVVIYGNGVGLTNVHATSVNGILTNNIIGNALTASNIIGTITNDSFGKLYANISTDVDITDGLTNPTFYDAFPGLIKLPNNTLLLVYRHGTNHVGFAGSIVKRTSTDYGVTWSDSTTLISDYGNMDVRDPSITLLQNGNIIMSYFWYDVVNSYAYGPYISISTNLGVSWSEGQNICSIPGATLTAVSSPVVEYSSNSLALAWYGGFNSSVSDIYVSRSLDGGTTWAQSAIITNGSILSEPNIHIKSNGDFLMLIRNDSTLYIQKSLSIDNGVTWSTPVNAFVGSASPRMLQTSKGNLYCFFRERNNINPTVWNRYDWGFVWRISRDEGTTWGSEYGSEWKNLNRVFNYASAVELFPGMVGVAYAMQEQSGDGVPTPMYWKWIRDDSAPSVEAQNVKVVDGNISIYNGDFRLKDDGGFTDFTSWSGVMSIKPTTSFSVVTPLLVNTPVAGQQKGTFNISSPDALYGVQMGISGNGNLWMQPQRVDGNNAVYGMQISPLGGNVSIGSLSISEAKLKVGPPDSDIPGLKVNSGTGAKGIMIAGRSFDNSSSLQFTDYQGLTNYGGIIVDSSKVYFCRTNLLPFMIESEGNMAIGSSTNDLAKLTIGEPDAGSAGLSVKSGTSADAIKIIGRANGDGAIAFKDANGNNEGAVVGSSNKLALYDKYGQERFSIVTNKITAIADFHIAATNVASPTLGANSGGFSFTETGSAYGLWAGINGTGDTWFQSQRGDGNTSTYNLLFNPSGGNVSIGTSSASGAKLTIGAATSPTIGLKLYANSAALAQSIIGRASDQQGYLSFYQNNGTSLEGHIYGGQWGLNFTDPNNADILQFNITGVGIRNGNPQYELDVNGATGTRTLVLKGATSGSATLSVPDVAGATSLKFPNSAGSSGNVLSTDGAGNLSWTGDLNVTKITAPNIVVGSQLILTNGVWDDLQIPGLSVKVGANAPTFGAFPGQTEFSVYLFGGGATDNDVYFTAQLPHSYKEGTDIIAHVHWFPTTSSSSKNIIWTMKYEWKNIGEVINGTASTLGGTAVAVPATAGTHTITSFAAMSGAGKTISSMILCHLKREASNGLDTYPDDVGFLQVDFHYQKDTIGSSSSTAK